MTDEQLELPLSDTWEERHKAYSIRKNRLEDDAAKIHAHYDKLRQQEIDSLDTNGMNSEWKWIKENCPHPEDKIEKKEVHSEGNYYDKSWTVHWRRCTVCGAESEKKHTTGYYG